jgi:hypothetical protein
MYRALIVLVAACATDPELVPPPPDHSLIGAWRYIPRSSETPVDERQVLEFDAEGRYSIRGPHDAESGTFNLEGNDVTLRSSTGGWVTTGYAVTADRLIVDALFPADGTDGLVGTWIGTQSSDQTTSLIELSLRADGTAHLGQTGSFSDDVEATWIHVAPYAVITFAGMTRPKSFPALLDVAIGEWLYERIR